MRPSRLVSILLTAAATSAAASADAIRWSRDLEGGVAFARRSDRPIMFYLINRSRGDDHELRRRQAAVFRDDRVAREARRFVTLQVSIDQHPELIAKWELPPNVDRYIVFTTPDGSRVHHTGVGNAEGFVVQMRAALDKYREHVWRNTVRPVLRDAAARRDARTRAVELVRRLSIRVADHDLIVLLDTLEPHDPLRKLIFQTLAELSTTRAVDALLDYAPVDEVAAAALERCNPLGAERMLDRLGKGDGALERIVYRAAANVCRLEQPRSVRFWETADEHARRQELRRLRERVREMAMQYREQQGE